MFTKDRWFKCVCGKHVYWDYYQDKVTCPQCGKLFILDSESALVYFIRDENYKRFSS